VAPFEKVRDERIAEGFRFSVHRVWFRAQDGTEFERHIVHHPGAVAVVPLHDDDTVTMVRQFRAALGAHLLELPAGLRDVAGEDDATTAARELIEETGLAAGRIDHLATFHNSPGYCDETVSVFLATDLTPVPDARQGIEEEEMSVERLPLAEVVAQLDDGRITDAKTHVGIGALLRRRAP
jgi:8-oxo-dGTP pyrophosphatase MutT (NUDIX family)